MAHRRFGLISRVPRLQDAYNNYKAWQDRTTPTNYNRQASSNPGGYLRMAVVPFGADAAQSFIIKVSRRANQNLDAVIGEHASDTLTGAIRMPGFEPAKAVVFRGTGGSTAHTSEITRLSYKKRQGVSYTHGFGAKTSTERELIAQAAITAALASDLHASVSFLPERLYAA